MMTEPEFGGDFVEDVFTEYLDHTTGRIRPPGTGAVLRSVRRRRRRRIVILAMVGTLMLVVPVAAYAITA
jgi:hypothetical protein